VYKEILTEAKAGLAKFKTIEQATIADTNAVVGKIEADVAKKI
jgi:hypothetical protein